MERSSVPTANDLVPYILENTITNIAVLSNHATTYTFTFAHIKICIKTGIQRISQLFYSLPTVVAIFCC